MAIGHLCVLFEVSMSIRVHCPFLNSIVCSYGVDFYKFFINLDSKTLSSVLANMELTQKIKNGTILGPSDSTSGNISKETQNGNLREYMHSHVHCSIIYNSQDLE